MRTVFLLPLICLSLASRSPGAEPSSVETYLYAGELASGEIALVAELQAHPKDDARRFGLGALQFLKSIEHLAQSLHRYGLRSDLGRQINLPFLRLPLPENLEAEVLTYPALTKVFSELHDDLLKAETTLGTIRDEQVKLPLRLAKIRFDLNRDGKGDSPLMALATHFLGGARATPENADLLIVFDHGDVAWMRGYCQLLLAMTDVILAHDAQDLFDATAHLFFARPKSPHEFLTAPNGRTVFNLGEVDVADLIAFIHLMRLPVKDPERMKEALVHMQQVLALSKQSWKSILAETDDDHEWLPNPQQKGGLGVPVRREMIESWLGFVDEAEALLAGKRLIPFWRGNDQRGVNLRRVFLEPRTLDLVLWVQGTAATPYLEAGELTRPDVWRRLQQIFGGEFVGFAMWFN